MLTYSRGIHLKLEKVDAEVLPLIVAKAIELQQQVGQSGSKIVFSEADLRALTAGHAVLNADRSTAFQLNPGFPEVDDASKLIAYAELEKLLDRALASIQLPAIEVNVVSLDKVVQGLTVACLPAELPALRFVAETSVSPQ